MRSVEEGLVMGVRTEITEIFMGFGLMIIGVVVGNGLF